MKLKSPTCSTGHGTGVTHCVDLRVILDRDRYRLRRKQAIRYQKQEARRHGKTPAVLPPPVRMTVPVRKAEPSRIIGGLKSAIGRLGRLFQRKAV